MRNLVGMYDGVCHSSTFASIGRPELRSESCTRCVDSSPISQVLRVLPCTLTEGELSQMSLASGPAAACGTSGGGSDQGAGRRAQDAARGR
eukprot:scaffold74254_cov53-Phaeocystis_antarctica.AAC.2